MKSIIAKLGNMRKAVDWVVYPNVAGRDENQIVIQSDKRICQFNPETGEGMLSNGKGHPGFHTLHPMLGAKPVTVPQEVIDAATDAKPKSGDTVAGGLLRIA